MTDRTRTLLALDAVLCIVVFLFALLPRLDLAASYDEPIQSEEELYNRYAIPWSQGEGAEPREKFLPWHPLGSFTHRPPGYSLFLGSIYKLAGVENFGAVRNTQAFMDAFSMVLLYILGALVFGGWTGRLTGLTAALGVASYDFIALFVQRLLSETLFIFLMMASLVLAVAGLRSKSAALTFLAALVLGLSNLTRPFLLFMVPGYILWLAIAPQYPELTWVEHKRRHVLAAIVGLALVFVPVIARNYQFHDRFILLSTNSGFTLYHSLTDVEGLAAPEELGTKEEVKAMELPEVEEAAEFRRRAVRYLIDHPEDWRKIMERKVRVLLAAKGGHKISHVLMVTPDDEWFYPLVLAGALLGVLVRPFLHGHARLLVYGYILSQVLVSLAANAEVRYRVPVIPLLALLSAWVIWGSADWLVRRFRPQI